MELDLLGENSNSVFREECEIVESGFMTNLKEECKNVRQKDRRFGKHVEQKIVS
jgi:hypothetical protein